MRQHIEHLAAALGLLAFALLISYYGTGTSHYTAPTSSAGLRPIAEVPAEATSTYPTFEFSTTTLQSFLAPQATSTFTPKATSTIRVLPPKPPVIKITVPKPAPTPKVPVVTPPVVAPTSTPAVPEPAPTETNLSNLRASI